VSIEVVNTTINAAKTIKERTWRATQFTEDVAPHDGSGYSCKLFRERKTAIEGLDPTYSRDRVAPVLGAVADGMDGTDASHYPDAEVGFEPEVIAPMADILAYDPSETITVTHPHPGIGEVTVPAAVIPLLLQGVYDLVATKANQAALDAALAKAIEAAAAAAE